MTAAPHPGPLSGLRILDISTVVAGPYAATLLADLGADVLKAEMPGGGDGLRALAPHKDGVPLWWKVTNRNKKGVTLDLRKPEGRELLAKLLADRDVLVENFRPGTLDGWGITREWLQAINPKLTYLKVKLKNEIYYEPAIGRNTNLDRSSKNGIEAQDTWRVSDAFTASLNYTFTRARIDAEQDNGGAYDGKELPGVPRHMAVLGIAWRVDPASSLTLTHT